MSAGSVAMNVNAKQWQKKMLIEPDVGSKQMMDLSFGFKH